MQVLILILKRIEMLDEIIKRLAEAGITGGTILEGTGMVSSLINMEDLPVFGMLRHILTDENKEACKVMLFVSKDEQIITTRQVIKKVIGNLNEPNTGIMFSVPITYIEGFGE